MATWVVIVTSAAVGSLVTTALQGVWQWVEHRRQEKAAQRARRRAVYEELLVLLLGFWHRGLVAAVKSDVHNFMATYDAERVRVEALISLEAGPSVRTRAAAALGTVPRWADEMEARANEDPTLNVRWESQEVWQAVVKPEYDRLIEAIRDEIG